MEQLITYRAKGKEIGLIFLFKYDLNGNLRAFEMQEGNLNITQINWMFAAWSTTKTQSPTTNFPATQQMMEQVWMKDERFTKVFEIEKAAADLSFEALWNLYDVKIAKFHAQKAFAKCKEETIIKIFTSIPRYNNYLKQSKIAKAHLATYINGQYYDNEYPTDQKIGKVFNPIIKDLAKKLTDKSNPHG
jgi:hypothetical protein